MPSLPKEVPFDAGGRRAWNLLLSAEEAAGKETQTAAKYKDHLIAVRVLGFFLVDFYDYSATHSLFTIPFKRLLFEIESCPGVSVTGDEPQFTAAQHAKIFELGLSYRNTLMRAFRFNSGPVLVELWRASRPSFDIGRLEMIESMQKADKTNSDARSAALFRGGYKCMITGGYDFDTVRKFPEIAEKAIAGGGATATECIHLFSEWTQDATKPLEDAPTPFTMLKMFGLDDEVKTLLGGQVNSLSNVLILMHGLHQAFDQFHLWLEEVPGQENIYKVIIPESERVLWFLYPPPAKYVTFSIDPDSAAFCKKHGTPLPMLPSRALIAIRGVCARVAQKSGAAEQNDQIHWEEEDSTVLAHDGSAGDLLISLLNARAVSVGV